MLAMFWVMSMNASAIEGPKIAFQQPAERLATIPVGPLWRLLLPRMPPIVPRSATRKVPHA